MKTEELESKISILKLEKESLEKRINQDKYDLSGINTSINLLIKKLEMKAKKRTKRMDVSCHALVRFFERVSGLNIDNCKKMILPDHVRKQIELLGDGTYPVESDNTDNFRVVVENNQVVTVIV